MFLKFISWYIAHLFLLVCSFQMYFHSLFDHSIVNLLFNCSVVSNSLWPHRLQHTRLCYASPSLKTCSNSCPLSEWYHPNISSSVIPFSSCLQSFPTSGSFPVSWFFAPCGQSIGASASASVLPINSGLISFRIDWFDLLAVQRTLKSILQHHNSKALILQHSAFFTVHLSHLYVTTGKTIALTMWTFVSKVISLLFNTLSRLVIAFLPRGNCLFISWLQSPSVVILEPKKIKSVIYTYVHSFSDLSLSLIIYKVMKVMLYISWDYAVICSLNSIYWAPLGSWVGKIPWRRKRQPTPVFLPGKFHGQRSLVGYSPWGRKSRTRLRD